MKKIFFTTTCLLIATCIWSQDDKKPQKQRIGLGVKAGFNYAKVRNASSINAESKSGFHVGGFFSPGSGSSKQVMGYRGEIIYSKQGYDFKKGSTTGTVSLDYIIMPNLTTISITKYFQIQLGAQVAYLLNAKADSSTSPGGPSSPYQGIMDYYNRFDYGFAGGVEIHPVSGLIIGARLNISLNDMYEQPQSGGYGGGYPGFIPNTTDVNLKNNVLQIYAGWIF